MMMLVSTTVRSPSTSNGNFASGQRRSHSAAGCGVSGPMQRDSNAAPAQDALRGGVAMIVVS